MPRVRLNPSLALALAMSSAQVAPAQPAPGSAPASPASPVALTTPTAPSLSGASIELARQSFERGVMLARQERWSAALEEFQRSRELVDRPRTAFNTALALERLGRYRESRDALEACLGMPGVTAESELVSDAQGLIGQVRESLSTLTLAVAPAAAEVRIDGRAVSGSGSLRNLEIDPGLHVMDVSSTGTTAQSSEFATRVGERISRRVDLAVAPGRIAVGVSRSDAVVSIDDEPVGHGTVTWQGPPGSHRVRVEAEGHTTFRSVVRADPGALVRVEVSLSRNNRGVLNSPVFWSVLGGVTLAAVVATAALLIRVPLDPDAGSSGRIFQGVMVSW